MKCERCQHEQPYGTHCEQCGTQFPVSPYANPYGQPQQPYGQPQQPYGQQAYNPYAQQQGQYPPPQYPGYPQYAPNPVVEDALRKAKNSLIFGIVGFFCAGVFGIVALILGFQAKKTLKPHNIPASNATAGIIFGIIDIVFWVIGIIAYYSAGSALGM